MTFRPDTESLARAGSTALTTLRKLGADPWLVGAVAAAGLGLVGGAVAVAELSSGVATVRAASQRVAVPVTTVRLDAGDLRPTLAPADGTEAVAVPPSGRFVGASASGVPVAMATAPAGREAVDRTQRFQAAFDPFGNAGPKTALAAAGTPILPPVDRLTAAATAAVAPLAAPPSPLAAPTLDPRLAAARPRPKPADVARMTAPPGVGGPLVVASLTVPTPDTPRVAPATTTESAASLVDEPRKMPKGAAPYLDIIRREARAHRVPVWVALGVIWVESKFDPNLRGSHGVLGMMQVMPSTARYIGYKGTDADLLKPEVNVKWGMKELAKDLNYAGGDLCLAVAKYKGGFLTKTVNAGAQRYCDQLRRVTGMDGVTKVAMPGDVAGMPKTAKR